MSRFGKRLSALFIAACCAAGTVLPSASTPAAFAQAETCSITVEVLPRNPYDDAPSWPTVGVHVAVTSSDGKVRESYTDKNAAAEFSGLPCGETTIEFPETAELRPSRITTPVTDPETGQQAYHIIFHPKPKAAQPSPTVPTTPKAYPTEPGTPNPSEPLPAPAPSGTAWPSPPECPECGPDGREEGSSTSAAPQADRDRRNGQLPYTGASVTAALLLGLGFLGLGIILVMKRRKNDDNE